MPVLTLFGVFWLEWYLLANPVHVRVHVQCSDREDPTRLRQNILRYGRYFFTCSKMNSVTGT